MAVLAGSQNAVHLYRESDNVVAGGMTYRGPDPYAKPVPKVRVKPACPIPDCNGHPTKTTGTHLCVGHLNVVVKTLTRALGV